MGWRDVVVFEIRKGSNDGKSAGYRRYRSAMKREADAWGKRESRVTLHIWVPGFFAIEDDGGHNNHPRERMGESSDAEITQAVDIIRQVQIGDTHTPASGSEFSIWRTRTVVNRHDATPISMNRMWSRLVSIGSFVSSEGAFWQEICADRTNGRTTLGHSVVTVPGSNRFAVMDREAPSAGEDPHGPIRVSIAPPGFEEHNQ